jgi:hypothetical protein
VRKAGLEIRQLLCIEPATGREGRLLQSLDSLFAERDLKNPESIEGHSHARPVSEEIHERRIPISGGYTEIVGRPGSSLNGWRQHAGSGRRCLARASLAYHRDRDSAFGHRRCYRESDQPSPYHDNFAAQPPGSLHFLS